ncbi:hypothetical protein [Nocardioides okcheonensis]|uniref:hypothetical protein n=1 Tax=Nocardioides okcheonensis TaxID=2894081 RepID=UPI001E35DEA1|nr:hypothetical protein [Nocardioides okcheonensis]UFN45123.1 hypothetical protein LN652_02570 [Nocardioides okcheonensis]
MGTNVSSRSVHRALVEQATREWSGRSPGSATLVKTSHGLVSAVVRIPCFGAEYVVPVLVLDGTSDAELGPALDASSTALKPEVVATTCWPVTA